jgi:predicted amidohydrolase
VHIGVEDLPPGFYLQSRAHIAYSVRNLEGWKERLRKHGYRIIPSVQVAGMSRFDTRDPFGNKVELIEHHTTAAAAAASTPTSNSVTGASSVALAASKSEGPCTQETCSKVKSIGGVPYFWHTPRAYESKPLLRLSVFQGRAVPGDVEANLSATHAAMQRARAAGAQLLLFPEMWLSGYDISRQRTHELAITEDGETMGRIADWCRSLQIAVCFGYAERCGELVFNSAALLSETGKLLLNYRKCQLWMDVEKSIFAPSSGESLCVVTLEPHALRVGINICYDCEFPETSRTLAVQGAQLILVPTALAKGNVHETVPLLVAPTRALDNHVWLAYSNLVGRSHPDALLDFAGLSALIGPDGQTLRRLGDVLPGSGQSLSPAAANALASAAAPHSESLGDDLIVADLLPSLYAKRFETTPLLVDRRPDLYAPLLAR